MKQSLKRISKGLGLLLCTFMMALAAAVVIPMNDASVGTTDVVKAAAKLNTKSITMTKGKTAKIKVSGTKSKVTYKTSNKKIAKVSSKGVVTGVAKGKTTIKVKVGSKTYKVSVNVEKPSISKTSISIKKGNTYKLKVNGTSRKVKWSSNNKSVATVSSSGKVTAKGKGQAVITAKLNDKSYTCKVTVGESNVIKCPDSITLKYGETKTVTLTAGDGFKYGVENPELLSVSISPSFFYVGDKLTMTVTGEAVGTTYIVFKSDEGWTRKCKVTVTGTSVNAGSVSGTIDGIKINSIKAYRSCNASDPELLVEQSITNNTGSDISKLYIYYTLYDNDGNAVGHVADCITKLGRGNTNTSYGRIPSYLVYGDINKVASVVITGVEIYK